ncbi:PKD domain-containing protein [Methanosarcina sp. UBA411]|jgi:beta propeller repeat protein|uniref:PKD domain-containing protein n=1 Tax=Methanosarcina sp. UBA411 TaxID=1915589 RepID=UPI0025FA10FB|nr:PKD domain-containing protein [Methanosarcina sp. UBA411]
MILLVAFILVASCGIGSAYTETRLSTNTADQTNPSLWGNYIVWQDARNGGSDIYLTDMAKKIQTQVTKGVDAENPCVSGNRIVWQDKRNGNWDIYMYEISSKKTTRITTNTSDQTNPEVYGNYIVWQDTRNGGYDIYLQDLSTKEQTRVTSDINSFDPAIYSNKIAYANENEQIMLYDISTKKTTIMLSGGMIPFDLSIYDNRILYNDMFTGIYTYLYDFGTEEWVTLPFDYVEDPVIYNNKIVYTDRRNENADIYMCTLSESEPTPLPPVADFYATPNSGNAPLTIKFTDKSTGSPTSWKWSFGDGSDLVTEYNPIYTYSKPGTYTVKETVSNAVGKDTEIKTNYITVTSPLKAPVASFSASPTSGNAPLQVQFTDKSTGSPTSWKWNFGDGTYSTDQNPAHTYSKTGKYTISLTVKNAKGSNTVTKSSHINVAAPLKAPVAALSASPTSGNAPLKVRFTDKSSNSPTSWKWDFGDKSSSAEKNPSHTYSTAGTYTVKLTASNAAGSNTVTKKSYITVKKGSTSSDIYISNLRLGASGETPNQEYVQITNKGITNVKMNGWKITDNGSKHTYYFPSSYTLNSKSTVTLYTGKGTNTATKLYWGRSSHVWNNEGDTAYLYDAQGTLVSKLTK